MKWIGLLMIILSFACATSPRGRKQLILLPDEQMSAMGVQAFSELKQKTPIERNPAVNAYVQCVAKPLSALVPASGAGWEIVVFNEPETVNAFALPGGKIGVYTGLLKVAKNSSQLAAVIGHEIGHVIAKHGNERVSEAFAAEGGLAIISAIAQNRGPKYGLLVSALGLGAQFGILLPHSRTQESEADLVGLELMAKAGFDPHEAVGLWQNMSASGGGQPPEFLSTHPSHASRIGNIQRTIPEVIGYYNSQSNRPNCQM